MTPPEITTPPQKTPPTRTLLILALILFAGAALRVHRLHSIPLSEKEALILAQSAQPLQTLHRIFIYGGEKFLPSPIPYLLLSKTLSKVFPGETAARIPGILFGILSSFLIFLAARRLCNEPAALISTAFFSLSPYTLLFNREISHFSLALFLVTLSTCAFSAALQSPKTTSLALYALSWLLSLTFFPLSACLIPPMTIAFFLCSAPNPRARAAWTALNLALLALSIPPLARWLTMLALPSPSFSFDEILDVRILPTPHLIVLYILVIYFTAFYSMGGFFAHTGNVTIFHVPAFLLLPILLHVALFFGLKPLPGKEKQRDVLFILLAFTLPAGAAVSFLALRISESYLIRSAVSFIPALPPFIMLIAAGIARSLEIEKHGVAPRKPRSFLNSIRLDLTILLFILRRFRLVLAFTLLCAFTASVSHVHKFENDRTDWKKVSTFLLRNAGNGDAVVFLDGWTSPPFLLHAPSLKKQTHSIFPDFAPTLVNDHFLQDDLARPFNPLFASRIPDALAPLTRKYPRLWILIPTKKPITENDRLEAGDIWIRENTTVLKEKTFKHLLILLVEPGRDESHPGFLLSSTLTRTSRNQKGSFLPGFVTCPCPCPCPCPSIPCTDLPKSCILL
ncbi:MAG: glycosyltransferase family 39 protein [bacterium]